MTEPPATLRVWSADPVTPDVARSAERLRQREDVQHVVLLPDVHLAKACLDAGSACGRAYLGDVAWARTYAAENRLAMLRAVEAILKEGFSTEIDWTTLIHSDRDHVRRENHFGEGFWIHRKGAQPASAEEAGVIPGSMGTSTFHVEGRGSVDALRSCSHGAGRRLSRTAARQSIGVGRFERQLRGIWFDHRRSEDLREEAPEAYKDIERVLRAQSDLVKIRRRLEPLLSYKGR